MSQIKQNNSALKKIADFGLFWVCKIMSDTFIQYTIYENWVNIDYIFSAFHYQFVTENDNTINFCWLFREKVSDLLQSR